MLTGYIIVGGLYMAVILNEYRLKFLNWLDDGIEVEIPEVIEPPKDENRYMEGDEKA